MLRTPGDKRLLRGGHTGMHMLRAVSAILLGILFVTSACTGPAVPNEAQVTMTPATTLATPPEKPPTEKPPVTVPVTATTSHYCTYCHYNLEKTWAVIMAPPTPPTTPPTIAYAPLPVQGHYEVWINGREYRPSVVIVPVGTTITWVNKDGEGWHTVTSTTGLFDTNLAFEQSFSYTFTERGIYEYYSSYWPAETIGAVHVI